MSNAPYFSTDAPEDMCNVVEAAGSKESSGGVRRLHNEIPSTSGPPINAPGPCAEAPRSNPSEVFKASSHYLIWSVIYS